MYPSNASVSYKGLTGHWTKWGGNVHDVFERQGEDFTSWFCQSCGKERNHELAPYFQEYQGEYIRICAICARDECTELNMRIQSTEIYIKRFSIFGEYHK